MGIASLAAGIRVRGMATRSKDIRIAGPMRLSGGVTSEVRAGDCGRRCACYRG